MIMGQKLLVLTLLVLSPLAFYPLLRDSGPPQCVITGDCPRDVPEPEKLTNEDLARTKPVEFLEFCLAEYDRKVTGGYRCHFVKQERVKGNLRDPEKLRANFRAKPFSVHMEWLEGAQFCVKSMYVESENDGKLLAASALFGVPTGITVARPVDAPDARATSRFPITEFGIRAGAVSTINAMKAAQARGTLHVSCEGIEAVAKLGDRPCYKLVRTPYDPPEDDNCYKLTIWIDCDTLLHVGSELIDVEGNLIAEYYFRDIELNPTFDEKQFTRAAL
jgi:uncharacterized protein DUF1571